MRKRKNKYWLVDDDAFDVAMVKAGVASKHDLAEKSGLDYSVFTHLYSRPLTTRSVTKICMALKISANDFFTKASKK